MKKTLYSLLLLSAFCNAQVTSFPWKETFEINSPTSPLWTKMYEFGNKEWDIVSVAYSGYLTGAYEGNYMAEFDVNSFNGDTTKYVSPVLNLSSMSNPTLDFFYRNRDRGGDQNELRVYYRTSPTSSWNLINTYYTSESDWTTSGILSLPFPSSTYQIALEGVAKHGFSINVDNVKVNGSVLSTAEVGHKDIFRVYPNPICDDVNITSLSKIKEISIIDFSGKVISRMESNNNNATISVHDLPSGDYIIQAKTNDGVTHTKKIMKK